MGTHYIHLNDDAEHFYLHEAKKRKMIVTHLLQKIMYWWKEEQEKQQSEDAMAQKQVAVENGQYKIKP